MFAAAAGVSLSATGTFAIGAVALAIPAGYGARVYFRDPKVIRS